jgi:ribose 5-phosphate isomerase B
MTTIFFGSDYNGTAQIPELKKKLATFGKVIDVVEEDPALDSYIKISMEVARRAVREGGIGVMVCGSGTGSCITANKIKGAYAVNCLVPQTAVYAKIVNNANVLCLASWGQSLERNLEIIETFFAAQYGNRKPERMLQIKEQEELLFKGE